MLGELVSFTIEIPVGADEADKYISVAINGPVIVNPLVEYISEDLGRSQDDHQAAHNSLFSEESQPDKSRGDRVEQNELAKSKSSFWLPKMQSPKHTFFSTGNKRGKRTGFRYHWHASCLLGTSTSCMICAILSIDCYRRKRLFFVQGPCVVHL